MRNARGRKAARRISISWYGEFGDEIGEATNHSFDWSTVDTRRQLRRKWKSTSKKEHKKTAITVCDLKSCNGQPGSHRCPIYKWRDTLTRRRKKAGGMDQQTRKELWRFGRERKYKWIIRKSKEQLVQLKERERKLFEQSSSLKVSVQQKLMYTSLRREHASLDKLEVDIGHLWPPRRLPPHYHTSSLVFCSFIIPC